MTKELINFSVAILVADGFEQSEMVEPRKALNNAGAKTTLISPEKKVVRGWSSNQWAEEFEIDLFLEKANPADFNALVLPGGVMNPDKLRTIASAIEFIKIIATAGKPIGAICHGPWSLINAQAVKEKTVTSWPSLEIDLINAGAKWIDKEVVIDENIITSRKPADIPAFNTALIKVFSAKQI